MIRRSALKSAAAGFACLGTLAFAGTAASQTHWDMAMVWPQGNFHVQNAMRFAEEVERVTDGEVAITVHPGGALGLRGPEMMAAVRDGIVPVGDVLMNQQVGLAPFLGMESVPYLAPGYEDLKLLQSFARPHYDEIATQFNQKILYIVPWPGQAVHSRRDIQAVEDMAGMKIRTVDKNGTDFFSALGALPVQLPWGEVVPSLASGAIDAVTTSSSSAVDGAFWEFLTHTNRFNWQGSSNMVTVNLDAWNRLSPEHQDAIEALARELEPEFWQVSIDEDAEKLDVLRSHGIDVSDPNPELREQLLEVARPMWDAFIAEVGSPADEVIEAYLAARQ